MRRACTLCRDEGKNISQMVKRMEERKKRILQSLIFFPLLPNRQCPRSKTGKRTVHASLCITWPDYTHSSLSPCGKKTLTFSAAFDQGQDETGTRARRTETGMSRRKKKWRRNKNGTEKKGTLKCLFCFALFIFTAV